MRVSETSAMPSALRSRVPAKITSSILVPRRVRADCSPSTQLTASRMLDLPQPFGPDDGGHALAGQDELGAVAEGLKAEDLDFLELEHRYTLGSGEGAWAGPYSTRTQSSQEW